MSSALAHRAKWEAGSLALLERQAFTSRKHVPKSTNLTGQTALITGSNVGLGLEAGRQLLQLGLSHLVLAVRSKSKGDNAAAGLRKAFPAADVSVLIVDLESYDSIKSFAKECEKLPRLDIAILNAGLIHQKFERNTATGHESVFQVMYLSTILLTILLLPIMRTKRKLPGPSRLSVVTSDVSFWAPFETTGTIFQQFDDPKKYVPMDQYGKTKLLVTAAVAKLATFVNPEEVILNSVNPGLVKGTAFSSREKGGVFETYILPIMKFLLARSVTVGASTYLDAVLVQGPESHGSYCSDWTIKPYPGLLYTEKGKEMVEKAWQETMEELNFAGASAIVSHLR